MAIICRFHPPHRCFTVRRHALRHSFVQLTLKAPGEEDGSRRVRAGLEPAGFASERPAG